jgi:TRAP-type C4-dicarboxylate transport system substrate-binding protein
MRHTTTSSRPIRTAADWAGIKIRTPPAKISVDLFATLGASPTPLDSSETYTSLQTHLIDAEESPLTTIEAQHFYEIQRYLSLTNHQWAAYWLIGNLEAVNALPPDIRAVLDQVTAKYSLLERRDVNEADLALIDKLKRQGMIVNTPDTASMRAKLGPYYARWKNELGATAWGLLEAKVGKLG